MANCVNLQPSIPDINRHGDRVFLMVAIVYAPRELYPGRDKNLF